MTPQGAQGVAIRRAVVSDAAMVAAYRARLLSERPKAVRVQPLTEAHERKEIEEAQANGRAFILIATADGKVVGHLGLWAGTEPHNRHAARFGVSVDRDLRRLGIGRRLIETAIRETKAWPGFCRIDLECDADNGVVIRLYESLGFVVEGRMRKSRDFGGGPQDSLLMALVW